MTYVPPCGPRFDIVGGDPCGGSYNRDCRCGWRPAPFPTIEAAQAAYDAHIADTKRST